MSKKVAKWEEEYKKYAHKEYDEEYKKLKAKFERNPENIKWTNEPDDKSIKNSIREGKEQYERYKKMGRIKENLPKVKNLIQYRRGLEKEIKEIDKEIKLRENLKLINQKQETLEKKNETLEKDLADLRNKYYDIELQLKKKDLSDDKRTELENELPELQKKIDNNNIEFSKNEQEISKNKQKITESDKSSKNKSKLSRISDEELNNKKLDLSTKISKCNMACKYMMQGKSWDAIEAKLDRWNDEKNIAKQYTVKQGSSENSNPIRRKLDFIKNKEQELQQKRTDLEKRKDEFDKKLEKLQTTENTKWYQFVKRFNNWRTKRKVTADLQKEKKDIEKDEELLEEELNKIKGNVELEATIKSEDKKGDSFKEQLKMIAEKGIKNVNKEKFAQMKIEAANRYADKYGNDKKDSRYNHQDGVDR